MANAQSEHGMCPADINKADASIINGERNGEDEGVRKGTDIYLIWHPQLPDRVR